MSVLKSLEKNQTRLLIVLIALVVFSCFMPSLSNEFVWDDEFNLIENLNYRGLSSSHLYWMFTTFHDANYHPLCWLSFGIDFVFWRMNPVGYHLTNIALHVSNTILFYFLIVAFLQRIAVAPLDVSIFRLQISAFTGALFFAVHPLRVEAVAWISTRGDLLCGFFYLLTIISCMKSDDRESG